MELIEVAFWSGLVAGAVVTVFLATYLITARPWRTTMGLNIVTMALIVIIAALLGALGRAGYVDVARWGAVIVWNGVTVVYVWQEILLLKAQGVRGVLYDRLRRTRPKPRKNDKVAPSS